MPLRHADERVALACVPPTRWVPEAIAARVEILVRCAAVPGALKREPDLNRLALRFGPEDLGLGMADVPPFRAVARREDKPETEVLGHSETTLPREELTMREWLV